MPKITHVVSESFSSRAIPRTEDEPEKLKKLIELCKEGGLETARTYCSKNSEAVCDSVNFPIDTFGNMVLHLTVSQNDHIMTCLLLLKGANPNIFNKSGVTPLMIANQMGFSKIAGVLIQCGAIINDRSIAAQLQLTRPLSIKERESSNPNQGLFGSFARSKVGSKPLVAKVVDIEGRNLVEACMETGIMILPDAAYLNQALPLLAVIRKDTLKDADEHGSTVLMKTCYSGHVQLAKELITLGADVDSIDKAGNTALVWAVMGGKEKIVKLLVDNGASIDGAIPFTKDSGITFKGQLTPLIAAAYLGLNAIISYLVKEQCDVNLRVGTLKGRSAIMVAAWSRRKDTVQLLLQSKAYVDVDVNSWLLKGVIYMKKTASEKNAWVGMNAESMFNRREQTRNDITTNNLTPEQIRRKSLQDKLVYFSAEESDVVGEIGILLSAKAGLDHSKLALPISSSDLALPSASQTRISMNRGRNREYRQGLNLDKIIGSNSDAVIALGQQIPESGTELDSLWIGVFQCVVQLVMAANKNIKHHYITISAKTNHCAAEIVRAIEQAEKKLLTSKTDSFCDTAVKVKIRDLSKIISSEFPKQLMLSTRMAIGVWPAPDAVSNMISEASSLATSCRELVLLANTLGYFPVSDKKFEVSFQPFEEALTIEDTSDKVAEKDSSLKSGLSYNEYKRQNDLKLIQEMSKNVGIRPVIEEFNEEEAQTDSDFFTSLDSLLKQFVAAACELKQLHDQHLAEEFINASSKVFTKADNIMEEILSFELLKDIGDEVLLLESDIQRLAGMGVKLQIQQAPAAIQPIFKQAFEDVKAAANTLMARAKIASSPWPAPSASTEMLQSSIPCLIAVKKLVTISKEAVVCVRNTGTEERRKRDAWRKECLANERVKQLFDMWQTQVESYTPQNIKKNVSQLNMEELNVLEDTSEGLVIEEVNGIKRVKGGKLAKLVEVLTSHNPTTDEEFKPAFLMTHHSMSTSAALMDQLIKRYDLTPPYGLNQRMFEIYVDKKVVQVRLKVCHALLYWIQNHFEEDYADNEFLIMRFRDFIGKKVMFDFEPMAIQILEALERQLVEHEKARNIIFLPGDRPKSLTSSLRFGFDPLSTLLTDPRSFLDIDPLEMARQLTLLEHDLYSKFQAYECLDQIWESQYKKEIAGYKLPKPTKRHLPGSPNSDISKMIRHTNEFTFWVSTSVVNNDGMKGRVSALKYFVLMAQHSKDLNNLTGVTTIVAGLSMGPVSRMHKTWKSFATKNPKLAECYTSLQETVSPKFQYSNYRKCLKEMTTPAIPFLGVFLTDLTFLDLGNPDFLPESHLLNFDKRRKVYQLIKEIQKYQQTGYSLLPVAQIQEFMKRMGDDGENVMTEDQLYNKSMEVEPKEASSEEDNGDDE